MSIYDIVLSEHGEPTTLYFLSGENENELYATLEICEGDINDSTICNIDFINNNPKYSALLELGQDGLNDMMRYMNDHDFVLKVGKHKIRKCITVLNPNESYTYSQKSFSSTALDGDILFEKMSQ